MTSPKYQEWSELIARMLVLAITKSKNSVQLEEADALMLEWGNLHDEIDEIDSVVDAKRVYAHCMDFQRRIIELGQRIEAS